MTHYENIDVNEFEEFAKKEFGANYPLDLKQFKEFFSDDCSILEVGCGWGRLGKHLIKKYKYTGIDIYEPYLKHFRGQLEKEKIKHKNLILKCSILDFKGAIFDVILFPWTVVGDMSLEDQVLSLKECKKMLEKGGVILIDNPAVGTKHSESKDYNPTKFYYNEWVSKLENIGFLNHSFFEYKTLTDKKREVTVLR